MLPNLPRILREIRHLIRETFAVGFHFEAMKELICFDARYWGGGREPIKILIVHHIPPHRQPKEFNVTDGKIKCS